MSTFSVARKTRQYRWVYQFGSCCFMDVFMTEWPDFDKFSKQLTPEQIEELKLVGMSILHSEVLAQNIVSCNQCGRGQGFLPVPREISLQVQLSQVVLCRRFCVQWIWYNKRVPCRLFYSLLSSGINLCVQGREWVTEACQVDEITTYIKRYIWLYIYMNECDDESFLVLPKQGYILFHVATPPTPVTLLCVNVGSM